MKFKDIHSRKFIQLLFAALVIAMSISACTEDDDVMVDPNPDPDPDPQEMNMTSGFVVVGTTASETSLVKYYDELPSGSIDLSDGKDYQQFFPAAAYGSAIYCSRPDGASGFSKMVVNSEGEIVEEGVIATADNSSFRIAIRDEQTGVFQDRATPDVITVFDPSTLEITGSINMSQGFVPGKIPQRYQRFIFRGDDVFAPIRGNDGTSFSSFILHQANLTTNSYVGFTKRDENATIFTTNNFGQGLQDTNGDLYVQDGGNFEGAGIPARLHKIPAGSNEFDPNYDFTPSFILNPSNVFLPNFNSFKLVAPGLGIAKVNQETPQAAIDIVLAAGGIQNLTPEQIQEIFGILFSAETAVWCELDVNAQTVTPIAGIPAQGVFTGGSSFEHDGAIYLPVSTTTESAYYRYTPGSPTGQKVFDVTGAEIVGIYNLEVNN